jgi:hypothetical protein
MGIIVIANNRDERLLCDTLETKCWDVVSVRELSRCTRYITLSELFGRTVKTKGA